MTPPSPRTARPAGALRAALMVPKSLASLQLTVALFALSVLLVLFGTLAQKNAGVWTVVDKYFYSWFVWVDTQQFANFAQVFFGYQQTEAWKGAFPFPAGKLIGWAMFVNLLAAHLMRFRLTWKRSGIFILHAGVVLLLVGEYVTREFQVEQRMTIAEGDSSAVAIDMRDTELAFTAPGGSPGTESVVVIPAKQLIRSARTGERIAHPDVPFDVAVLRWMPNASPPIRLSAASPELREKNLATQGRGTKWTCAEQPEVSGTEENQVADTPAAFVAVYRKGTDTEIGRFLVAVSLAIRGSSEELNADDVRREMSLRFTEYHKPFKITLLRFTHERYLGTDLPKNFCSRVRIDDPEMNVSREVDISMNEPLRYRGEAFFQSGFDDSAGATTVLQVVRNPGWTLPYISCVLVALGMTVHFLIFLVKFLGSPTVTKAAESPAFLSVLLTVLTLGVFWIWIRPGRGRRDEAGATQPRVAPVPLTGFAKYAGVLGGGLVALYLVAVMFPSSNDGKLNLSKLAGTPVVDGGRVKPLDTVARVYLRRINEREDVAVGSERYSALKWFMEVAASSRRDLGRVKDYPVFRIQNLEVLSLLGLQPRDGWRYSMDEIRVRFGRLDAAANRAAAVPAKDRTVFDLKVLETASRAKVYLSIMQGRETLILPPNDGTEWRSLWSVTAAAEADLLDGIEARFGLRLKSLDEVAETLDDKKLTPEQAAEVRDSLDSLLVSARDRDPASARWSAVLSAFRSGDQAKFDEAVAAHQEKALAALSGGDRFRVKLELFLNRFAPYYHAIMLYGAALVVSLIGWVLAVGNPVTSQALRRAAFWMVFVTFLVHSFTLLARMYLMDRPLVFVTNLYSSAVFIGWVAAGVCLVLEKVFPIGLGNLVASALGVGTCIVGHNLATADTLEMMRAVLDTNFWLATHVTTVTFGYSATYIAGVIGLAYIVLGLFTPRLGHQASADGDKKPQPLGKLIGQAMYGVLCMATLFSFVGTVLGGIWADQSWGRFWGWDPKENGAVMIVLWNTLILHARWCGLVRNRGTAILSLVGNMITTWSWFGTNQLGVGLHAYGFDNKLAMMCVLVWASHLVFIAVALSVPPQYWRSDVRKA